MFFILSINTNNSLSPIVCYFLSNILLGALAHMIVNTNDEAQLTLD